ncbi:glycoside hydrolase family 16 protein [Amycolatopsis pithecellobii]|uniref:glycoside hydrolase family 16 protein n=1 Tax=Amycolatopsis pithecellobii TaxID=664692 RepID=UPI00140991B3|nr:glycoside hydrolase family 16 protein [Amycolatopsis pithecellobii]
MKSWLVVVLMLLTACSGDAGGSPPQAPEDFDGSALDATRWVAYNGFNQASGETWQAAQCTVSDGLLRLRADSSGICGVASRTQRTYGKTEVRARFPAPAGQGLAPVFLYWPEHDADWPQAGEIDWLECYDTSRQSFGSWIHYAGPGGGDDSDYAGDFRVDMTQWHTYGVEWSPSQVRVSVDGQVWHVYSRHLPTGPMHLVFQINRIGPVTGTAEVDIDWVHESG